MHISTTSLLTLLLSTSLTTAQTSSPKRGLVFVPNPKHPSDNQIWVQGQTDLTWYYNYQPTPSPAYLNLSQETFEFVPMLWSPSDTFFSTIESLIKGGRNITHVMGYNEPDGEHATGGSSLDPKVAAKNWISQMNPLSKMGVKLGAPAVTGSPRGMSWLKEFFGECLKENEREGCTVDFFPSHWYGSFEGLASHLGEVAGTYPNKPLWITEYALNNQSLPATQSFFNTSAAYFDRLENVARYSYFGSFRSDVSNVGPNAAMLSNSGELTDIGAWYLGRKGMGVEPGKSEAGKRGVGVGVWGLVVGVVVGFVL